MFVNKAWNSCYRNHEANVMPRTRQIDGSTYGINVIVIVNSNAEVKFSQHWHVVRRPTRAFTNTAGRQCPWTSCFNLGGNSFK